MPRVYSSARDKILAATERVILRDGPHGVSVDAVLAESGMSKGGFFHHFPTKAALLGELLERLSPAAAATAAASMRGDSRLQVRGHFTSINVREGNTWRVCMSTFSISPQRPTTTATNQ